MRRTLLAILLCLSLVWSAEAGVIMRGSGGGGGGACSLYEAQATANNGSAFGQEANNAYIGQRYIPPATIQLCQVDTKMTKETGNMTGHNCYALVHTMTGDNINLPAMAMSSPTECVNLYTETDISFTFSSPPTLTGSTQYAITFCQDSNSDGSCDYDGSNYVNVSINTSSAAPFDNANEYMAKWQNTGTQSTAFTGFDLYMKVYDQQ